MKLDPIDKIILEVDEAYRAAASDEKRRMPFCEEFAWCCMRFFWRCHLEPPVNSYEAEERMIDALSPVINLLLDNRFDNSHIAMWWFATISCDLWSWGHDKLAELRTLSFENFANKYLLATVNDAEYPEYSLILRSVWTEWKSKIINLSPSLVGSIKDVYQEYLLWLQKHPDAIDKIAWEAFEKLIAEIFASRGFRIDLTGRIRNASADMLAVRADEFGVESKYLIECKRYRSSHRVGLDIVNGVIGAAKRAMVDHAFLVTSSYFTEDVNERKSEFKRWRLHLKDGDDVKEWLKDYRVRNDCGLWLAPGWDKPIHLAIGH